VRVHVPISRFETLVMPHISMSTPNPVQYQVLPLQSLIESWGIGCFVLQDKYAMQSLMTK
jgi:hypothetical protein